MKALLLEGKGRWAEMRVGEMAKPSPKEDEVLVKVYAVGLNPVDYKTATGGNPHWSYPHILGVDVAGIVETVGENVTQWRKGDRVVYHGDLRKQGGYAEYAVTTAHTISLIPDAISFEEAAAIPCAGFTAYQALFRKMNIRQGETILIHAGAGGVGGFAIQLAKQSGLTVITTASRPNHDYVHALGADYAIDYKEGHFVEQVSKIMNNIGVDAVLDTVSRQNATESLDVLAFNGRIAYIAGAPDFSKVNPFTKALSYHEIALGAAHASQNLRAQMDLSEMGKEMMTLIEQKRISPMLEQVISLEEVPKGLSQLAERHVRGKIVAKIYG